MVVVMVGVCVKREGGGCVCEEGGEGDALGG